MLGTLKACHEVRLGRLLSLLELQRFVCDSLKEGIRFQGSEPLNKRLTEEKSPFTCLYRHWFCKMTFGLMNAHDYIDRWFIHYILQD